MEIKIHNERLTGYYLREKLGDYPEESGLVFEQKDEDSPETIKLTYNSQEELEHRLSFILMMLTDK